MQAAVLSQPAIPFPEYRAHPAYRSLDPMQPFAGDEDAVAALVAELDRGYRSVLTATTAEALAVAFDREVLAPAESLQRQLEQGLRDPFRAAVLQSLRGTLKSLWKNARDGLRRSSLASCAVDRDLHDLGYLTAAVGRRERDQLYRLARPFMELLLARAQAHPGARSAFELPRGAPLVRAAQRTLRDCGLLAAAERNRGSRCEVRFITLHYAHADQTWYRNCYADIGLPTARWSYLHYDKDETLIKAMLCLHEIEEDGGPFAMVSGSGRWSRNEFLYAYGNFSHAVVPESAYRPGFYYRSGFDSDVGRRWWLSLPRALQVQSHFGDDLLDDSASARVLEPALKVFTGADALLFDGARALHLGGTARKQPRWVIHIGLEPVVERDLRASVRHWLKTHHLPQRVLYLARRWRDALRG